MKREIACLKGIFILFLLGTVTGGLSLKTRIPPVLPQMIGFAVDPFENTIEAPRGRPAIRIGCENWQREFHWHDYSNSVLAEMEGPHYRHLNFFVLMRIFSYRPNFSLKRTMRHLICRGGPMSASLSCHPNTKTVGLDVVDLEGRQVRLQTWRCQDE